MGVSRSPAELVAKVERAARSVDAAAKNGVKAAALVVTESIRSELRTAAPSGRLRGVGKAGAKLSVGFDIKGTVDPTALVRARGPWQLIERNTKAHDITPKKRGGKKALAFGGGNVRLITHHPGTRGKHPFEEGVAHGAKFAEREFQAGLFTTIRKVF